YIRLTNDDLPMHNADGRGARATDLLEINHRLATSTEKVNPVKMRLTSQTRVGWDKLPNLIDEDVERLQDVGIQAISIHARTRKQMYKGEADWSYLAKVKANPRIHIPVFGNGDVDSPEKALAYRETYGVDGIMVGRASIGYPW